MQTAGGSLASQVLGYPSHATPRSPCHKANKAFPPSSRPRGGRGSLHCRPSRHPPCTWPQSSRPPGPPGRAGRWGPARSRCARAACAPPAGREAGACARTLKSAKGQAGARRRRPALRSRTRERRVADQLWWHASGASFSLAREPRWRRGAAPCRAAPRSARPRRTVPAACTQGGPCLALAPVHNWPHAPRPRLDRR